jgi:hypothetical protein
MKRAALLVGLTLLWLMSVTAFWISPQPYGVFGVILFPWRIWMVWSDKE